MKKKISPRAFLPLAIFLVLVVFLAIGLRLNPRELPSTLIDQPAPDFLLPQLGQPNQTFSPRAMRGQEWLLNVWGSWCVACGQEHPTLVAFARQQVLPIVGLNYKDSHEAATDWLKRLGDPYQLTAVDADGRIGIEYGVYGAPETFLIDREGIIRHKYIGPLTPEVIEQDLLPRLQQLRTPAAP